MRLIDLLHFGEKELKTAGVEEYQIDARILLEYCTGKSRTGIFLDGATSVNKEVQVSYQQLLESRKKRQPLAYIIGEQEFWSLPFFVSPDVLIPRPETEFLLDRVLALTDPVNFQQDHILDLCCGSGVIAIVLAKETGKTVIASDISWQGSTDDPEKFEETPCRFTGRPCPGESSGSFWRQRKIITDSNQSTLCE